MTHIKGYWQGLSGRQLVPVASPFPVVCLVMTPALLCVLSPRLGAGWASRAGGEGL